MEENINEKNARRAILKGGVYTVCIALLLLGLSVLCAFLDTILGFGN